MLRLSGSNSFNNYHTYIRGKMKFIVPGNKIKSFSWSTSCQLLHSLYDWWGNDSCLLLVKKTLTVWQNQKKSWAKPQYQLGSSFYNLNIILQLPLLISITYAHFWLITKNKLFFNPITSSHNLFTYKLSIINAASHFEQKGYSWMQWLFVMSIE